jgi:hypothetical protein
MVGKQSANKPHTQPLEFICVNYASIELLLNFYETTIISIVLLSQVPVAHAYNLSYWGGRVQEDRSSKPAPGK